MGIVMKYASEQKDLCQAGNFLTLPSAATLAVESALISPGKVAVNQAVGGMTGNQLAALVAKLDSIYRSDVSHPIANLIAEEIRSIITLVRILSQAAQGSSEFAGILASGQQLDVWPLRPKDIGGVYLNGAGTGAKGLYGGVSAGVFSWYRAGLIAGTISNIIPTQTTSGQSPFGGMVLLGATEKTYTPKIESVSLVLQGQPVGTIPAQPAPMTMKRTFGEGNDISIFRLEKPVIITQNESFGMSLMPNVSGATNFEPIAIMCGQVQSKVL
jgi:hypothetical protein